MGVSLGIDMSRLDVCFGGFTPTVMGDMTATWDVAVEAEQRLAARKDAAIRAEELEAARESALLEWVDEAGTVWEHVLLDGASVRIKGCRTQACILDIPAQIEGHPVLELAPEACANLPSVVEATVPDSVIVVGDCAFRGCSQLERVVLPAEVSVYLADWFRYCNKLSHLELPGALEAITPRVFDHGHLRTLVVGPGTRSVEPGAFINSHLESIQVAESNPFMATDGRALYSKGWSIMAALAAPSDAYAVRDGCRALGKKAFSSFTGLSAVDLPSTLEAIGPFAFAGTALRSFHAPSALRIIQEKAFYGCRQLAQVQLDEGLESIGPSAFEDCGLAELRIPASVQEMGAHVADGTDVRFSGEGATFGIEGDGGRLVFDGQGGLYERDGAGFRFVRLMDPDAVSYEVLPGTVELGRQAFECARKLREVRLPEGLWKISGAAFRGCMELVRVNVPDTVAWVGGDAFLDTRIETVQLSAGLEHLGPRALVTLGAHHGQGGPSLHSIVLTGASAHFRMHEGMLLERKDDGAERVVIYVGPDAAVHVPEAVDEICAYAFNGASQVKELHLSDRITTVGPRGLAVDAPLEHIHVDLAEPIEGHAAFDIFPPRTDRSEQQMMLALTVPTFVSIEALFEHYDNAIINASSFDALSESGLGVHEQAVRLIQRLEDPVFMGPVSQDMARRVLRNGLCGICLEMARHDDRDSLRRLADLGILSAENIDEVISAVQQVQDASMTGYLLEVKRMRFGVRSFDFSL